MTADEVLSVWSGAGLPGPSAMVLVFARVLGACWPMTAWGLASAGVRLRLLLGVAGALVVAPAVDGVVEPVAAGLDPAGVPLAALGEAARGAVLGLGAALVVGAARQAGELIGGAAGLSPVFDAGPTPGGAEADEPLTPTGVLYVALAVLAFLALDGPLRLVLALVGSYEVWPPGVGLGVPVLDAAVRGIGAAVGLALRLAVPVALPIVAAQGVLGLASRWAPVPPWSAVAWPLRQALAVVLVALAGGATLAALRGAWGVSWITAGP